jgi:hypothetical protein
MRSRMIFTHEAAEPRRLVGLGSMGPSPPLQRGPVSVSFRDAQNYRWKRHSDGPLEQLEVPRTVRRSSVKDRLDAFAKGQMDEKDAGTNRAQIPAHSRT